MTSPLATRLAPAITPPVVAETPQGDALYPPSRASARPSRRFPVRFFFASTRAGNMPASLPFIRRAVCAVCAVANHERR